MNKINTTTFKLRTIYFWSFLFLCIYQVVSILYSLNIAIVSLLIRLNTLLALTLVILELYTRGFLIRYTKKILLQYYFLVFILLIHFLYYQYIYIEKFDFLGRSSSSYTQSFILGMIVWSIIGAAFYVAIGYKQGSNSKSTIPASFISFILLLIFIVANQGISELNYSNARESSSLSITHLTLGSFVIYPLIYLQVSSKHLSIYLTLIFNFLILYMIGGRADLILYMLTTIVYYFLIYQNKKFIVYSSLVILTLSVGLGLILIINNASFPFITEILSVFDDTDSSKVARIEIMVNNISDLSNKIFFGNPNYFIDSYDNLGTYTHNIISMWEFFGFFTFLLVIIFIYNITKYMRVHRKKLAYSLSGNFSLFLGLFVGFQLLISKPAVYYPFWFFIGFISMLIALNETINDTYIKN